MRILGSTAIVALVAAAGFAATSGLALAQSSVPDVIAVCEPVIDTVYEGDRTPWGRCVAAVESYLRAVGAPSAAAAPQVADLVVALTELYRYDRRCIIADTELPLAIRTAANFAADGEQRAQIVLISETIAECDEIRTAAINNQESSGQPILGRVTVLLAA